MLFFSRGSFLAVAEIQSIDNLYNEEFEVEEALMKTSIDIGEQITKLIMISNHELIIITEEAIYHQQQTKHARVNYVEIF